jgi:hypothetical protein
VRRSTRTSEEIHTNELDPCLYSPDNGKRCPHLEKGVCCDKP